MTIRNMQHAFRPRSVAVVGASVREGSMGLVVVRNILSGGFAGPVYPVNPKYEAVEGLRCYARAADLPEAPDVVVVVTPPQTVPGIIGEFGERGTKAAVVITAGLTRENGLRQAMRDAARPHMLRIIGPNTLGLMIPTVSLNAGFGHMAPPAGNLALLSQSGALATSLIDWAAGRGIGFSHIVSLGDMADVDVADYLDLLAGDPGTQAILLYLESVPEPRKFMSAARAAARIKPVIAVKSGRHEAAAKAAATHTGALSGADRVVDAALRRAGILRVRGLADLFDAAETTGRFPPLQEARLGIVTNGGGAGVLAVDQLIDSGGQLATLSADTLAALAAVLPANWSNGNPVDIIGDASPQRYRDAVGMVAADPAVDALLVINCPTGLASSVEAAGGLADVVQGGQVSGKPVLACWLGEATAAPARRRLQEAGVASFETPSEAARAIGFLDGWTKARRSLLRAPSADGASAVARRETAAAILAACGAEGRTILTEPEAKGVLAAYGFDVPQTLEAATPEEAGVHAKALLSRWDRVVVKLLSKEISHKSDVGGVVLKIESAADAVTAAKGILDRVGRLRPGASVEGFAVQPMIEMKHAHELILGMSTDPIFGPVILFGAGGVSVEIVDDTAVALPPIDGVLAQDLIGRTRISRLLAGYRDRPAARQEAIVASLEALSRLVVDFPGIVGIDINPLLANHEAAIALDARIEIDPARIGEAGPSPALAIRPYPERWVEMVMLADGRELELRPTRPTDAAAIDAFISALPDPAAALAQIGPRAGFPDEAVLRLVHLDYDREIAFMASDADGTVRGIARLSMDPERETGEVALLAGGASNDLAASLLDRIVAFARAEGLARLVALQGDAFTSAGFAAEGDRLTLRLR